MRIIVILSLIIFSFCGPVLATTNLAIASGNWNATGTWSLNRKPTCGDTIKISAGKTVTINAQDNLVPCGTPVVMYISGTLQFTNGNKLDFPCGSWVYITNGGIIKKSTAGGGNSTLISICGYIEWNAGDGQLNGVDTLGGHGTLPVTWLSIQASIKGKVIGIDWSTAVEINNDYFDVERSADGITYISIGRINGNGNRTTVSCYTFTDPEPDPGISYYKLIQVDYDGTMTPSDVVAVNNSMNEIEDIHLSPNPVISEANVAFFVKKSEAATIEIKNAAGQLCLVQQLIVQNGMNTFAIDKIGNLAEGVYTLVINTNSGSTRTFGMIKR
ncbi:hypothetical protein BH11BAC1_BH11BAC1_25880 [soil metagenome]